MSVFLVESGVKVNGQSYWDIHPLTMSTHMSAVWYKTRRGWQFVFQHDSTAAHGAHNAVGLYSDAVLNSTYWLLAMTFSSPELKPRHCFIPDLYMESYQRERQSHKSTRCSNKSNYEWWLCYCNIWMKICYFHVSVVCHVRRPIAESWVDCLT